MIRAGCSWPCDMAKESVWPNTHLELWLTDDDDGDDDETI